MILLDTHVWLWWMNNDPNLSPAHRSMIRDNEQTGIGVSVISCWEIALLADRGRIRLAVPVRDWVEAALTHPAVSIMDLTPGIAVESVQLPDPLHRDPADRILIATAIAHDCPLLTVDRLVLAYPRVRAV